MVRMVALVLGAVLVMVAMAWLAASIVMGAVVGAVMDTMLGGMPGGGTWTGLLAYPIALAGVGTALMAFGLWRRSTTP